MPTTEGESTTKGEQLALVPKSKAPPASKKKMPPKKSKTVIVKSIRCQGESSEVNEFRPCLVDPPSPRKPHGKNKLAEDFPMPKSDKSKLLGLAIHMGKFGKKWDETEEEKRERERRLSKKPKILQKGRLSSQS